MDITGPDGAVTHGADQDWFPDPWQQRAGCGPTAAALIFAYLSRQRPEWAPLYPEGVMERAAFTAHMVRVWDYVTPRFHGLNRPEWMVEGMAAYAASRGSPSPPPCWPSRRPEPSGPPGRRWRTSSAGAWSGTAPWPSSTSTTAG